MMLPVQSQMRICEFSEFLFTERLLLPAEPQAASRTSNGAVSYRNLTSVMQVNRVKLSFKDKEHCQPLSAITREKE